MKPGERVDPIEVGNTAIDIKSILKEFGFTVGQAGVKALEKIPLEVQLEIERIQKLQARYDRLDYVEFICKNCGTRNGSQWRKDNETGDVFLVCGNCDTVAEVK